MCPVIRQEGKLSHTWTGTHRESEIPALTRAGPPEGAEVKQKSRRVPEQGPMAALQMRRKALPRVNPAHNAVQFENINWGRKASIRKEVILLCFGSQWCSKHGLQTSEVCRLKGLLSTSSWLESLCRRGAVSAVVGSGCRFPQTSACCWCLRQWGNYCSES